MSACGYVFRNFGPPHDPGGCILPEGHKGPHEFVDDCGVRYAWETDWDCNCEHCRQCDGDYCMVYWEAKA